MVNVMWWLLFLSITVLVGIDQALKYFASATLKFAGEITIIPNLLDLTYVENRGAAFGMFQNQRWFFIVFAVVMIAAFIYQIKIRKKTDKMFLIAAVLVISGGIGNLIDRFVFGYVIDYIKLSFFTPVCNFADYCITFGAVILIVYMFFYGNDVKNRS